MKTIFNVYVEMDSQSTCDRMKQLCVDNGLPIWDDEDAFEFGVIKNCFRHQEKCNEFWVTSTGSTYCKKTTETEFIDLLKQYKNE